jgi:hypothetical protein
MPAKRISINWEVLCCLTIPSINGTGLFIPDIIKKPEKIFTVNTRRARRKITKRHTKPFAKEKHYKYKIFSSRP